MLIAVDRLSLLIITILDMPIRYKHSEVTMSYVWDISRSHSGTLSLSLFLPLLLPG